MSHRSLLPACFPEKHKSQTQTLHLKTKKYIQRKDNFILKDINEQKAQRKKFCQCAI